jgi:hypothetical protein
MRGVIRLENPTTDTAAGRLEGPLEMIHEVMNEPFYAGLLWSSASGAVDRLPCDHARKLLAGGQWPLRR